jgi:hypothetical protein
LAPEHKINANNWWKQNNTQILTILLMYKIKMKRFFLSETNVSIPCYSIELPVRPTLVNPIFLPIYTINGTCDMEGGYGGHHKKTNIMVKYYSLSFEKKKKKKNVMHLTTHRVISSTDHRNTTVQRPHDTIGFLSSFKTSNYPLALADCL